MQMNHDNSDKNTVNRLKRLDAIAEQFETSWANGNESRPSIEEFLEKHAL